MEHIKNISKTTFIACYGNGILKTPLENKKKKDSSLKTFACFQFSTFAKHSYLRQINILVTFHFILHFN